MTPTAPTSALTSPAQMPSTNGQAFNPTGAEAPAAPKPEMGRAAVTQVETTAKAALGMADPQDAIPEIPPDPPPVKGLGIPPLNTIQVGDQDEAPTPPPPQLRGMEDLLGALEPPAANGMDIRI